MLNFNYKDLDPQQKEFTNARISSRINKPVVIIEEVLTNMNPPIAIEKGKVTLFRNTLKRLEKSINKIETQLKNKKNSL